ncbi:MAG: DUF1697 domain-containing protein [Alphaproteobacteria bacterium]|nr:DUF1697 domain-containing protein [Alphaproteobacteria bacterium]
MKLAAFLRAVNVGGTGKLPMSELRAICEGLGFTAVQTYIASGNVVFETKLAAPAAKEKLSLALDKHMGKPVGVFLRDAAGLRTLLDENPFPQADGARHMIILLDETPNAEMIANARFITDEDIRPGTAALHVHYPTGQGASKLKIPGAQQGTARNRNTIIKMLALLDG